MTTDTILNPGDIVTVTDYDGNLPVAFDRYHANGFHPSKETYEVVKDVGLTVIVKEIGIMYGYTVEIPKLFLQLKSRVAEREEFRIIEHGHYIHICQFDKKQLAYRDVASINKTTPIEYLEKVIRLIKSESESGEEKHQ